MTATQRSAEAVKVSFDPGFLDAYTGGDKGIRNQVLEMFLDQVALLLDRLDHARGDSKAWHAAAHSLKGCAAGVGANKIADLARLAEQHPAGPDDLYDKALADLRSALVETSQKVREVLAN
jgi:HPt (histidine-containing phosphotransfer) domain-containing protein